MNINIPLKELSIRNLFDDETVKYQIPIYQRNYAWEKDEINTLVQDVYDSFKKDKKAPYYIGTLVTFYRGEQTYEIIDGQQRLTTLFIILRVLGFDIKSRLTFFARKKSDATIKTLPKCNIEEKDYGIIQGYYFAEHAIAGIIADKREDFISYFLDNVRVVFYKVPRDIDLNHYFEIMNSRGEQLEKPEIIKARLLSVLENDSDRSKFNCLWENCSCMSVYVQQKYKDPKNIFGDDLRIFTPKTFDEIYHSEKIPNKVSIESLIKRSVSEQKKDDIIQTIDSFQPIIDFPNFLLVVLKITLALNRTLKPEEFNLDDKEILNEFSSEKVLWTPALVKTFGFNLLKAKYLLDNYIVHHSCEDDTIDNNPWKLQCWTYNKDLKTAYLVNLDNDPDNQNRLIQLLSMFEVSFTPRQRKNYLFYCLLYLFHGNLNYKDYSVFLENLADKYFRDVYLIPEKLNNINTPLPGSFDSSILVSNEINVIPQNTDFMFEPIYGTGEQASKGIPLFIFNYLDYKLWNKYSKELRGEQTTDESSKRKQFFVEIGCSDFDLKVFQHFYFSRTRRSLEHYFPQADADGIGENPSQDEINCFGNYAMIGNAINSSGSNWRPLTKRAHYLDRKVNRVSVSSLKFLIMMQLCSDRQKWTFEEIRFHQSKMLDILRY